jgi:hypothetical protein
MPANSAWPTAACSSLAPSISMRSKVFLGPSNADNSGYVRTSGMRSVSPTRTSLSLSCSPVKNDRRAEPILTGRPSASLAARS